MVVQVQQIVFLQLHLAGHTLPTAGTAFQIGHPHDVIKRHPQSQPTGGFTAGLVDMGLGGVGLLLGPQHLLQSAQVQVCIDLALVVAQAVVA